MKDAISKVKNSNKWKIRKINYAKIDLYVDLLIKKLKKDKVEIDAIYGIPRGGLIIATLLSYRMNKPLTMKLIKDNYRKILIVDEICDSGLTMSNFFHRQNSFIHSRNIIKASLFIRKSTKFKPDYYIEEINKEWLKFFWEEK